MTVWIADEQEVEFISLEQLYVREVVFAIWHVENACKIDELFLRLLDSLPF